MKQLKFFIGCWLFLLLMNLFPTPLFAKSGAITLMRQKLEKDIYRQYDKSQIVNCLTDMKDSSNWAKKTAEPLKFFVAIRWVEQGFYREGAGLLDLVKAKLNPDLWMFYRATALVHLEQPQSAETLVTTLVEKHHHDPDVLFLQSGLLAQKQDYAAAIQVLNVLLKRSSRFGKAYLQRGLLYLMAMSHDQALEDLKQAIKFLPETEKNYRQIAFLETALVYLQVKLDSREARKFIESGVAIDPESSLVKEFYVRVR